MLPACAQQPDDSQVTVAAASKIRIVRLSEVKGQVFLDRNTGKGLEPPMANLPIVEGNILQTGNGVAEVELEDNSTIRIGQDSRVEFPRLELLPGGVKASSLRVRQGTAYINIMKDKENQFALLFGNRTVDLPSDSHVRLQVTGSQADLAVMHGNALVAGVQGDEPLSKNKTMTFHLTEDSQPEIAKTVAEMPLDSWDHDAVEYHKSYANASSFGGTPYSYGINDMNYYGSFSSGCGGSMWRPYFTNAGWDPYGSGAWAYYQGAGYSWVSPYPWGWTAFHSGSWAFCDGVGWGWRPNNAWSGLGNAGLIARTPLRGGSTFTHPRPPQQPPTAAQSTLVMVNMKSIPVSGLSKQDTFVFRGNSAGMGVPRGSLGRLNSFSGQAAHHGTASTSLSYSAGGGAATNSFSSPSRSSSASTGSMSAGSMQSGGGGGGSHVSAPAGGGGGHR